MREPFASPNWSRKRRQSHRPIVFGGILAFLVFWAKASQGKAVPKPRMHASAFGERLRCMTETFLCAERWYRLEFLAPHTQAAAERLCRDVLKDSTLEPRYRAEFYSKLGQALDAQAGPHIHTNRERAISLMCQSLEAYFSDCVVGEEV